MGGGRHLRRESWVIGLVLEFLSLLHVWVGWLFMSVNGYLQCIISAARSSILSTSGKNPFLSLMIILYFWKVFISRPDRYILAQRLPIPTLKYPRYQLEFELTDVLLNSALCVRFTLDYLSSHVSSVLILYTRAELRTSWHSCIRGQEAKSCRPATQNPMSLDGRYSLRVRYSSLQSPLTSTAR